MSENHNEPPFHVVLVEPEIPPNTGNIARLCAATGAWLHLVEPLGFSMDDRYLKRAGMDYWQRLTWKLWPNWEALGLRPGQFHLFSTKAASSHWQASYQRGQWLVFGRESRGLPESLLHNHPNSCRRIPMRPGERSINLGTSVGIALYEALRQVDWNPQLPMRGGDACINP